MPPGFTVLRCTGNLALVVLNKIICRAKAGDPCWGRTGDEKGRIGVESGASNSVGHEHSLFLLLTQSIFSCLHRLLRYDVPYTDLHVYSL